MIGGSVKEGGDVNIRPPDWCAQLVYCRLLVLLLIIFTGHLALAI